MNHLLGISTALFIFLGSMLSNNAQERLPLKMAPEDQGIKIERIAGSQSIKLSPSSSAHPLFYKFGTVMNGSWLNVISGKADPAYVNEGAVTTSPNLGLEKLFFKAVYPDFSKFNGFVRLPAGVPQDQLTTLAVWLHGDVGANAGYISEVTLGDGATLDKQNLVSYFPSAPGVKTSNKPGDSYWSGSDGPQAQDYAYLLAGIKACKDLVPTIKKVKVIGASQGVPTAVGLVQLYPEQFDGLLILAGLDSTSAIQAYLKAQNGGQPVRFNRPVPVVGVASQYDELGLYRTVPVICSWFAAANGFTGTAKTNIVSKNYYDSVPGNDSTIVEMGTYVRLIICTAKNHWDTFLFGTNGANVIYGRFIRDGLLPGSE